MNFLIYSSVMTSPTPLDTLDIWCPFAYFIPFAPYCQIRAKSSVCPNAAPFHCNGGAEQGCGDKKSKFKILSLLPGTERIQVLRQSWWPLETTIPAGKFWVALLPSLYFSEISKLIYVSWRHCSCAQQCQPNHVLGPVTVNTLRWFFAPEILVSPSLSLSISCTLCKTLEIKNLKYFGLAFFFFFLLVGGSQSHIKVSWCFATEILHHVRAQHKWRHREVKALT